MTKTKKRKDSKKRKKLRKLFNESGVEFYEPTTGVFKVNGVTYYPKAKKYQKDGKWIGVTCVEDFIELVKWCNQRHTTKLRSQRLKYKSIKGVRVAERPTPFARY